MEKKDIIVAGGGFAGTAAAIAAARRGMKVLLFEKAGFLGGAATNCLVTPFMPYCTRAEGRAKPLSAGIFKEILDGLGEMRRRTGEQSGSRDSHAFGEEHLKLVLEKMALDAGVTLLYHAYLCGVNMVPQGQERRITSVTVATKSGNLELAGDYFIDATGDADLAFRSGCPFHLGRDTDHLCQPMTLCFRLSDVDLAAFDAERSRMQELYRQFRADGKIRNTREDILVFPTIHDNTLHFNSTRIIKRCPTDPADLTLAEIEARQQVLELYLFLRENLQSMRHAHLQYTAAEIGVRESRMIDGLHLLTGQELRACTKFEDSIACGNYDIDIHNPEGTGTSHYYFPEGQYYEIPYRSLLPREVSNLLAAGRCISTDHEAQASVRIMPIVCCLGEAAGVGASVAASSGVAAALADISSIQRILLENGAVIH